MEQSNGEDCGLTATFEKTEELNGLLKQMSDLVAFV